MTAEYKMNIQISLSTTISILVEKMVLEKLLTKPYSNTVLQIYQPARSTVSISRRKTDTSEIVLTFSTKAQEGFNGDLRQHWDKVLISQTHLNYLIENKVFPADLVCLPLRNINIDIIFKVDNKLANIPKMNNYPEPTYLKKKKIKFSIDLRLRVDPISTIPYRIFSSELSELKKQLDEVVPRLLLCGSKNVKIVSKT
ncbi:hypothetical protein CR513_36133, partial [Mucuna pruriens]